MKLRPRSLLGAMRRFLVERFPPPDTRTYRRPVLPSEPPGGATSNRALIAARSNIAIGWMFEQLERPDRALDRYVRAAVADPRSEVATARAVRGALAAGEHGIVRTPHLGLFRGRLGDTELACILAERFLVLQPRSGSVRAQLARAYINVGDLENAERALEPCAPTLDIDRVRTEVTQLRGRSRGGLLVSEADELTTLWERMLDVDPHDAIARDRLVRHLVWTGDYARARRIGWRSGDPGPLTSGDDIPSDAPAEWLYAVHAETLADGDALLSHRVKTTIAERLAGAVPGRTAPGWRFLESMRALSYLGRSHEAEAHIAERHPHAQRLADELALAKLSADLRLTIGDVEPIIALRARMATPTVSAEQRFAETIRGASVLVVGPAPSTQPSTEDLAAADVVVLTKRPRWEPTMDTVTVVYSDTSTALLERTIQPPPESGIVFSVLRPSILSVSHLAIPQNDSVRVMQCEDSNTLLGTRLGVQRIVYDLLAYRPAKLVVTGIDFFLGRDTYVTGYANEVAEIYEPNGLHPARSFAPHDHLWDFRFIRDLSHAGAIEPAREVEALLDLSDVEYLERLTATLSANLRR